MSPGFSKSGGSKNESTPALEIENAPASSPLRLSDTALPSASVTVSVVTAAVFSGTVSGPGSVMTGDVFCGN